MGSRSRSLRKTLATTTVIVLVATLLAVTSLLTVTSLLHHASSTIGDAVESIYLSEEIEIELLLLERTRDPVVRRNLESRLIAKVARAHRYATTAEEVRLLDHADEELTAAFANGEAYDNPARLATVFQSLEALVDLNVRQARDARARVERWNELANALGIAVATIVIAVSAGLLFWLARRAFQPVLALADAMRRFGRGERAARAAEVGPAELREMAARFNEMASGLDAQRTAQIAFLAGVAHDLRGPLATLSVSVDLLEPAARSEDVVGRTRMMRRQIARLNRMVNDFLDMSKIEAGELELRAQPEDMRALVEDIVGQHRAAMSDHELVLALPPEPVPARCDAGRIEQVLTNLVSNAAKYSPPGAPIEVALAYDERQAVLRVTDHGVGMAPADLARLFEPFQRVGEPSAVPGLGLGLWISRRIIEAHAGSIAVASKPGVGTTFTVTLPRDAAAPG